MLDFNDLPNGGIPSTDTTEKTTKSVSLYLFKYLGERTRVNKTAYLTNASGSATGPNNGDIRNGTFRIPYDFISPQLHIYSEDGFPWNYVCILDNDLTYGVKIRYYFIDNIVCINNNLYEVDCTEDVLTTFGDVIGNYGFGFVDRNEREYNPLIYDDRRVVELGQIIEDTTINNTVFNNSSTVELEGIWSISGIHVYSESPDDR